MSNFSTGRKSTFVDGLIEESKSGDMRVYIMNRWERLLCMPFYLEVGGFLDFFL